MGDGCRSKQGHAGQGGSRRQGSALRPQDKDPGPWCSRHRRHGPAIPADCSSRSSRREVAVCVSVLLTVPLGASSDPKGLSARIS